MIEWKYFRRKYRKKSESDRKNMKILIVFNRQNNAKKTTFIQKVVSFLPHKKSSSSFLATPSSSLL